VTPPSLLLRYGALLFDLDGGSLGVRGYTARRGRCRRSGRPCRRPHDHSSAEELLEADAMIPNFMGIDIHADRTGFVAQVS